MKKYTAILSIMMVLSFSAYSSDMKITEITATPKPEHNRTLITVDLDKHINTQHNMKSSANNVTDGNNITLKACGIGYVVGVFSNTDVDTEGWAVWLSETGPSEKNKDVKIYWAYRELITNKEAAKRAYASILAAQASGQKVKLYNLSAENCTKNHIWNEPTDLNGMQFNVVKIWFP
ncbi:hypothetical protein FE392_07290 [Xenorhabdus sp. 12]|uniref:Uncharacterized protein n=1 Tax=Xenorhabdus santafensis TaxID=2582833 RepID=A0ABU4S8N9_9GAMM|nr:DUF5992 family protein [Xenorhabdus sp. 12]MDX7987135.1 hypothetical protein [Xenorhabdus sp. 12]